MSERWLKHISVYNGKVMRNLPYFLKDEGAFCKTQGDVYGMQGNFDLKLKKSFSSVSILK
ncbi:hypothetical protein DWW55_07025 [Paraprevotella clara]|nr:hypothetical protein DWW55_07025 [Paraprevotella clara]